MTSPICAEGWERNFVPKKFRGIDSEWFPLFRGRKCSFRGIPSSAEEPILKLGTEQNSAKKLSFTELAPHGLYDYSDIEHYYWNFGLPSFVLSRFSSAEWFGTEFRQFASIFFPRNGIPSCFLFRWRIRKGILRVFFYFCIRGKEFRVVFSSAEVFGREFREFASIFVQRNEIPSCFLFRGRVQNGIQWFSVPRNSRNSVGNNHLFRLFRLPRNYFFVGNS